MRRCELEKSGIGLAFVTPALIFFSIFVLYPILSSFLISLTRWDGISSSKVFIGLENYLRLMGDDTFWNAFKNNIIWVVVSIPTQLITAVLLAGILDSRYTRIIGRSFFRNVFFMPVLIPMAILGLVWKWMYHPLFGLTNVVLGWFGLPPASLLASPGTALVAVALANSWRNIGYFTAIYLAGMAGISDELYDAAVIDGASAIQAYRLITLPLLSGTIQMTVVVAFIWAIRQFELIWTMTLGGPGYASDLLSTFMYRVVFENHQMGYGTAIAVTIFLITMAALAINALLNKRMRRS